MGTSTTTAAVRGTKIKALLAGGLVLGVGAAVTLAAWTDDAYVEATFGTSEFNIQVTTDEETGWVEAATADDAATLDFGVELADALEPGVTVFTPLSLRTDETSVAADVTLGGATDGGGDGELFAALEYSAVELADGAVCDDAGVAGGTTLVPAGSPLTTGATDSFPLGAEAADPAELCFAVTLPEGSDDPDLQGLTTAAIWTFSAESVDPETADG